MSASGCKYKCAWVSPDLAYGGDSLSMYGTHTSVGAGRPCLCLLLGASGHASVWVHQRWRCVSLCFQGYECVCVCACARPWQVMRWQLSVQMCCPGEAQGASGQRAGSCWPQLDQPTLAWLPPGLDTRSTAGGCRPHPCLAFLPCWRGVITAVNHPQQFHPCSTCPSSLRRS